MTGSLAQVLVALMFAALLVNLVKGGWSQVWDWLHIKYVGKPRAHG